MAIETGDAIFRFLSDTTGLDQGIAKVEQIPSKVAPAGAAIESLGSAIASTSNQMAAAASGAKEMGDVMQLSGEKARFSMYEARGEVMLLGQEIGVRLPRHVASFLAELPGVGSALTAAFGATAVLFIGQAIIQGLEKAIEIIKEYRKHAKEVADAWDLVGNAGRDALSKIEDETLSTQIKIDDLNHNHLAALHDRLVLIDHASLKELGAGFDGLKKKADDAFKEMEKGAVWRWLVRGEGSLIGDDGIQKAQKSLEEFTKKYDILISKHDELGATSLLASELDKVKKEN